jgi:hypothetical protein
MRGQAPYLIEFRWVYGPPIPIGLDPEARETLIAQRLHEILERVALPTAERSIRATTSQLGH